MVCLVLLLDSAQDPDGVLNTGFTNQHLLETTLERRILFDPLAILIKCRRTDHAEFAASKHWLEHVARVHGRVTGSPRTNDGVQLINEGNNLAITRLDFVEY